MLANNRLWRSALYRAGANHVRRGAADHRSCTHKHTQNSSVNTSPGSSSRTSREATAATRQSHKHCQPGLPTVTTGSGLVPTPFSPRFRPSIAMSHASSLRHSRGRTRETVGGSYSKGVVPLPLSGTVTTNCGIPFLPGPDGATHSTDVVPVTVTFTQGLESMVTTMIPGKKFCRSYTGHQDGVASVYNVTISCRHMALHVASAQLPYTVRTGPPIKREE